MSNPRLRIPRVLAALAMGCAFLVMASVFSPFTTEADNSSDFGQVQRDRTHSVDPHEGLAEIGSLDHKQFHVRVFATDGGPRFSVYDADGDEIAALMSAERVTALFPELPLTEIDFSAPEKIMMAPADEASW